jgi:hypothetical protein
MKRKPSVLTGIDGGLHGEAAEVAAAVVLAEAVPVRAEDVARVRGHRAGQVASSARPHWVAQPGLVSARRRRLLPHRRLVHRALVRPHHAPQAPRVRPVVQRRRQRRVRRQRAAPREVHLVHRGAVGVEQAPVPLRAGPPLEVLVEEREHHRRHAHPGPPRRAGAGRQVPRQVAVVRGRVPHVGAELVQVAGRRPPGLGQRQPHAAVANAARGGDHRVEHLVEEVGVREPGARVVVHEPRRRLEQRVGERHDGVVRRPGEVGVGVEEEVGLGALEEGEQRAHDGVGDVGPEHAGGRREDVLVVEVVHAERGADLDAAEAVAAQRALDVGHGGDEPGPAGPGGGVGEDLVADEEVAEARAAAEREHRGGDPGVRGALGGGEGRDELVGDAGHEDEARGGGRGQEGGVGVVEADGGGPRRAGELHPPVRGREVVAQCAVVDAQEVRGWWCCRGDHGGGGEHQEEVEREERRRHCHG